MFCIIRHSHVLVMILKLAFQYSSGLIIVHYKQERICAFVVFLCLTHNVCDCLIGYYQY